MLLSSSETCNFMARLLCNCQALLFPLPGASLHEQCIIRARSLQIPVVMGSASFIIYFWYYESCWGLCFHCSHKRSLLAMGHPKQHRNPSLVCHYSMIIVWSNLISFQQWHHKPRVPQLICLAVLILPSCQCTFCNNKKIRQNRIISACMWAVQELMYQLLAMALVFCPLIKAHKSLSSSWKDGVWHCIVSDSVGHFIGSDSVADWMKDYSADSCVMHTIKIDLYTSGLRWGH